MGARRSGRNRGVRLVAESQIPAPAPQGTRAQTCLRTPNQVSRSIRLPAAPIAKRSRGTAWGFNPRSGIRPPSPPHPEGVREQMPRPSVPQIPRIIRHLVTLQQHHEFLLDGLPESATGSGPWWRTRCGTPAGSACYPWCIRRVGMRWPDCIMVLAGFMGKPGDRSGGQSPPTPSGWERIEDRHAPPGVKTPGCLPGPLRGPAFAAIHGVRGPVGAGAERFRVRRLDCALVRRRTRLWISQRF